MSSATRRHFQRAIAPRIRANQLYQLCEALNWVVKAQQQYYADERPKAERALRDAVQCLTGMRIGKRAGHFVPRHNSKEQA